MDIVAANNIAIKKFDELTKFHQNVDTDIVIQNNKLNYLEKKLRINELREYLNYYGMILRKDSILTKHYINTGEFQGTMKTVDDICRTMYHAEYLSKIIKPLTGTDTESLKKSGRDYKGMPSERHLFNSIIETEAIGLFVKKYEIVGEKDVCDIVDAVKYIISNPSKFDLTNVNANITKYPW